MTNVLSYNSTAIYKRITAHLFAVPMLCRSRQIIILVAHLLPWSRLSAVATRSIVCFCDIVCSLQQVSLYTSTFMCHWHQIYSLSRLWLVAGRMDVGSRCFHFLHPLHITVHLSNYAPGSCFVAHCSCLLTVHLFIIFHGPLLLRRFNFNPSMDK